MSTQEPTNEIHHAHFDKQDVRYRDSLSASVPDVTAVPTPSNAIDGAPPFDLRSWIENRNVLEQSRGIEPKSLGLSWNDVTVLAPSGTSAAYVHTLPLAILNTFGPDAFRIASRTFRSMRQWISPVSHNKTTQIEDARMRKLIQGHTGLVKDGEMLLVLGRPGSGCSTFLKAVSSSLPSNVTLHPNSEISYGGLSPSEIRGELRGEVIYSGEEDVHSPTLSVADTLRFALRSKVPNRDKRLADESSNQFVEKYVCLCFSLGFFLVHLFLQYP